MNFQSHNTVLVTGGGSGIGLGLVERFLKVGDKVIIVGRDQGKLQQVKEKHPELIIHAADVSKEEDRVALFDWIVAEHPDFNVLINNAGIQREVNLVEEGQSTNWKAIQSEITINYEAPIHLSLLFIPHLIKTKNPVIANVTSGLAFVPMSRVPVYCSTKAALHSFTLSLRHQLSSTSIKVVEIIPPAVNTDLGGADKHTFGVALDEYSDATFAKIQQGELEVPYGFSVKTSRASREEMEQIFAQLNSTNFLRAINE